FGRALQPQQLSQTQCPAPIDVGWSLSAGCRFFNNGLSSLRVETSEILRPGQAIHIRTAIHWTATAARPERGPAVGFRFSRRPARLGGIVQHAIARTDRREGRATWRRD